jgi:hypothetical protein
VIIYKSLDKISEQTINVIELGDPQDFGFIKKYINQWYPKLTKAIYDEQSEYSESNLDITKNIRAKQEFNCKEYLTLFAPEKLSLLVIREIFKAIFDKILSFDRYSQNELDKLEDGNDISYHISVKPMIKNLSIGLTKEIYFEFETEKFDKEIENNSELSQKEKNFKKKKFKEKLMLELKKDRKDFFSGFNDIIPHQMKIKLAGLLLFIGTLHQNCILINSQEYFENSSKGPQDSTNSI